MTQGFSLGLPLSQMFRQRHHIAILFLSLGLALLGIFLWLFLKKTWDDEAASLRRETNSLFVNAVHGIERQMFDRLIMKRWEGAEGDTSVNISLRLPTLKHGLDAAKIFAFVEERSIVTGQLREKMDASNTQMKVIIKSDRSPDEAEMSGALSMLMSTDSTHLVGYDSVNSRFLKSLEQNFGEAMQRAHFYCQRCHRSPAKFRRARKSRPHTRIPCHFSARTQSPHAFSGQGAADVAIRTR